MLPMVKVISRRGSLDEKRGQVARLESRWAGHRSDGQEPHLSCSLGLAKLFFPFRIYCVQLSGSGIFRCCLLLYSNSLLSIALCTYETGCISPLMQFASMRVTETDYRSLADRSHPQTKIAAYLAIQIPFILPKKISKFIRICMGSLPKVQTLGIHSSNAWRRYPTTPKSSLRNFAPIYHSSFLINGSPGTKNGGEYSYVRRSVKLTHHGRSTSPDEYRVLPLVDARQEIVEHESLCHKSKKDECCFDSVLYGVRSRRLLAKSKYDQ